MLPFSLFLNIPFGGSTKRRMAMPISIFFSLCALPASWVLRRAGAEKIGTAGPPPGLSVGEDRETVERLSLRRGETLILCSDGINGEDLFRHCQESPGRPFGTLASELLEAAGSVKSDDATVAAVRLRPELLEA